MAVSQCTLLPDVPNAGAGHGFRGEPPHRHLSTVDVVTLTLPAGTTISCRSAAHPPGPGISRPVVDPPLSAPQAAVPSWRCCQTRNPDRETRPLRASKGPQTLSLFLESTGSPRWSALHYIATLGPFVKWQWAAIMGSPIRRSWESGCAADETRVKPVGLVLVVMASSEEPTDLGLDDRASPAFASPPQNPASLSCPGSPPSSLWMKVVDATVRYPP